MRATASCRSTETAPNNSDDGNDVHLFSGLSDEALAEIEQHSTIKNYKKNTIIIN